MTKLAKILLALFLIVFAIASAGLAGIVIPPAVTAFLAFVAGIALLFDLRLE